MYSAGNSLSRCRCIVAHVEHNTAHREIIEIAVHELVRILNNIFYGECLACYALLLNGVENCSLINQKRNNTGLFYRTACNLNIDS